MKKLAFTLAEVLITLGIIGVVAAMTIPTLIANTNSAKFKSQYKKTLSALNQAAKMAESKYDLNFASSFEQCGDNAITENPETTLSMCALLNGTMSVSAYYSKPSELKIAGSSSVYALQMRTNGDTPIYHIYQFTDGSILGFNPDLKNCTLDGLRDTSALPGNWYGFIDVNGTALPNKEVVCSDPWQTIAYQAIDPRLNNCIVRNNSTDMGDIFPIVFHDGVVEPFTTASRYVLNQAK